MNICKECHQEIPDPTFITKVAAIIGPELELYDFGGGMTIVPAPDLKGGDLYLTSYIVAIMEYNNGVNPRFLMITIEPKNYRERGYGTMESAILERLPEAKAKFNELASSVLSINHKI